jgi:hypothetical protein
VKVGSRKKGLNSNAAVCITEDDVLKNLKITKEEKFKNKKNQSNQKI